MHWTQAKLTATPQALSCLHLCTCWSNGQFTVNLATAESNNAGSIQPGRMHQQFNDTCQVHRTTPVLEVGLCVVCGLIASTSL